MDLKKILKKINKEYFARVEYIRYYKKLDVNPNIIFLEAQNSKSINGNIYYLAKELNNNLEYKKYKIYFSINKRDYKASKKFLKEKGLKNIILVKANTKRYFKLLARAKYLLTDTSFTYNFIKKDEQVILNTWHGTPLKTLGKKVNNDFHSLGNVQRCLAMSDYLLYPNEYTMEHMVEDYMISNISNAKILFEGYPRNEVFLDKKLREEIREKEGLKNKQVIAYMPTWRGNASKVENKKQLKELEDYLNQIDSKLNKNQIIYVNLHPFVKNKINFEKFTKIKKFPENYETYEFLCIADSLITDYSSVFFDFAITGKKIILFTYDEEEYLKERGLYISLNELPFPKVNNIEELVNQINSNKQYDDKEFIQKYCKYDNVKASQRLCAKVILNKDVDIVEKKLPNNGKENVLIYVGSLSRNGITSSIKALLNNIDLEKRNYYINFKAKEVQKHREVLKEFPKQVNYIPIQGKMNLTILQKIFNLLYRKKIISNKRHLKNIEVASKYEIKRLFPNMKFASTIQFGGYGNNQIILYSLFDSNKVIYVHSDMVKEIETRGNQNWDVLNYAYNKCNKIALVTDEMLESTKKIANREDGYYIVNNIIDYKQILELSEKDIKFDAQTQCNFELEEVQKIMNSDCKKIVTIGRFSPEKGHKRLIDSFDKVWSKDRTSYLIIVGGNGKLYNKTLNYIRKLESKDNIILIKSLSNPYAVLKKCDYFILPSFYEGFGLVIAEADILGKPVVSTDIVGPKKFMEANGGTLVENSDEGIYKGLEMLLHDEVKTMNVDYEKYNQNAIKQFEKLLI